MKTCVITLDLINEICHSDGKLARYADRIKAHRIIENSNKVLAWARSHNHLIAHVKIGFRSHYRDSSAFSPLFGKAEEYKALSLDQWGTDFCVELDRHDDDCVIVKHRVSAFYGTDLEVILRANRIERLILLGVATNNAVELTAREAHDRDYVVTVVSDAVETASDEEQRASLGFLSKIASVCTIKQLQ